MSCCSFSSCAYHHNTYMIFQENRLFKVVGSLISSSDNLVAKPDDKVGLGSKWSTKKVIEYCYEAEMEETYRSCMLKAFRKTLDERKFSFVIVDDRNLREADFSQFWAVAKTIHAGKRYTKTCSRTICTATRLFNLRSGYEVYLLEAPYKDPMGCAARNLHGFTLYEIQMMAAKWEQAPQWLYLRLDIQSLFHGDDLKQKAIREVNINMKNDTVLPTQDVAKNNDNRNNDRVIDQKPESPGDGYDTGPPTSGQMWDTDTEEEQICVRDLSQSKWLKDIEREIEIPEAFKGKEEQIAVKGPSQSKWSGNVEENIENPEASKGNGHVPSGLVHAYRKSRKSVLWGDRADLVGFSIGSASSKPTNLSLVIGPRSGYNLKSNPLSKEEKESWNRRGKIDSEKNKRWREQLRAEWRSVKIIFDQRWALRRV